jgi:hypothetical protein
MTFLWKFYVIFVLERHFGGESQITCLQYSPGYFVKVWESQKLVIRKCPSSQIPFFTYKLLAEFGF